MSRGKNCLENLEFILDAELYRMRYNSMVKLDTHASTSLDIEVSKFVSMLWKKLLDVYIMPNGLRQVNLPAAVRDRLLYQHYTTSTPDPAALRKLPS